MDTVGSVQCRLACIREALMRPQLSFMSFTLTSFSQGEVYNGVNIPDVQNLSAANTELP
jgi:hypothetical protein